MPDESVKWLGIGSIALAILAAWFMLRKWPKDRATSISGHAGAQRVSYLLFAGVVTLAGLMFAVFILRWFAPTIDASWPFYAYYALGFTLQMLTAWLPDDGSGKGISLLHRRVAFSMAAMMQLLVGCIALAPKVALVPRITAWVVFALMTFFWYLYLFVRSSRDHFLVYQTWYIASFYIVVMLVTYVR